MSRKALVLNTATGRPEQSSIFVLETADAVTTPAADAIPRADGTGQIPSGWIPASVRSINIREADGSPAYVAITDLVVGNGDLSYLGGGVVRLRTAADAAAPSGGSGSVTITDTSTGVNYTNVTVVEFAGASVSEITAGTVLVTASGTGSGGGSESVGGTLHLFGACY